MIKTESRLIKYLETAAPVGGKSEGEKWFDDMTFEQQHKYLKFHPNSKFASESFKQHSSIIHGIHSHLKDMKPNFPLENGLVSDSYEQSYNYPHSMRVQDAKKRNEKLVEHLKKNGFRRFHGKAPTGDIIGYRHNAKGGQHRIYVPTFIGTDPNVKVDPTDRIEYTFDRT
jgi:hypothetical protein